MPSFQKIAVVGCGTMGAGIAQVVAAAKREAVLIDTGRAQLERARGSALFFLSPARPLS